MSGTSRPNSAGVPALDHWLSAQETLATVANLAIVMVGAENDVKANVANETSVCRSFLNDPVKSTMCAEFCGRARQRALAEGGTITYRCGANLHCFAAPVRIAGESSPRVLIGGRTFLSTGEYRDFLARESASGTELSPALFSNIKFTDATEFQRSQKLILTSARELVGFGLNGDALAAPETAAVGSDNGSKHPAAAEPAVETLSSRQTVEGSPALFPSAQAQTAIVSSDELRSFFVGSFEESCDAAMRIIGSRFPLRSAVLLMRSEQDMTACAAGGEFGERLLEIRLDSGSGLLNQLSAVKASPVALIDDDLGYIQEKLPCLSADAFALFIGEELTGILIALDSDLTDQQQHDLVKLVQTLIVPLELARLRSELSDQNKSLAQRRDFAHLLATRTNALETYSTIVEKVSQALEAERVSLLVLNEESKAFACKAAIGLAEEAISGPKIGAGISSVVLERGEPLLVRHLEDRAWVAAHAHRSARTDSFISFPILAGGRRLAVINVTDRIDDHEFTEADLEWLAQFAPYVAAALEKIDLHEKAQRFEMLAITDPLTGLLNRRYLEERFAQEIERSKRYQFPLSFVMMDIDSFKSFNDTFGHQAGDEVLRETAHCIRRSLRNFDVAARYGGEEFIVVLPETDVTSATILAERLRKAVEQHFVDSPIRRPVTVSIGVSSLSRTLQNRHQVIKAADQALYAAKKRGKNCVVVYNTELVPGLT